MSFPKISSQDRGDGSAVRAGSLLVEVCEKQALLIEIFAKKVFPLLDASIGKIDCCIQSRFRGGRL